MNKPGINTPSGLVYYLLIFLIIFSACAGEADDDSPRLKHEFSDAFLIGTAMNRRQIYGDDTSSIKIIKNHFNTLTP
jgi:endo-1,4-beta-xylanase